MAQLRPMSGPLIACHGNPLHHQADAPMAHQSEEARLAGQEHDLSHARIFDASGTEVFVVALEGSTDEKHAWMQNQNGPKVLVPLALLELRQDGTYRLPFAFDASMQDSGCITVPVMQEELRIAKRMIDTGRGIRIHKTVSETPQVIDQPLLKEELEIEHISIDAPVADGEPPKVRYEGDTLVVPVLEEVLVVQKQLRLKEEVRITRRRREVHAAESVLLRSEQVSVERFEEGRASRS